MTVPAVSVHRWTREEYERLAEDGFFEQEGRAPSPMGYRSRTVLGRGDTVSPLARPEVALAVDDLLP
ncbi:MAG TPA: hypothetical protein VGR07_04545 [Thermoanaerobaculia bacterium]|jgi:hypothetical protein|nr:hypothetical protein [Thermoanaerobaculia bacterium]